MAGTTICLFLFSSYVGFQFAVGSTSPGSHFCYQCADSSGRDGKNDCQINAKTMAKEAGLTLGKLTTDKVTEKLYVKNCSAYGQYCVIEKFQTQGDTHSFIRDCSDGKTFSVDVTKIKQFKFLSPDNQTQCARYLESTVCISVCRGEFCNGPLPTDTSSTTMYGIKLTAVCLLFNLLYTFLFIKREI